MMNPLLICTILVGLWVVYSLLTGFTKWYHGRRADFATTADFHKMLVVQLIKIAILLGSIIYVADASDVVSALSLKVEPGVWTKLGGIYCFIAFIATIFQAAVIAEGPASMIGPIATE